MYSNIIILLHFDICHILFAFHLLIIIIAIKDIIYYDTMVQHVRF